MLKKILVGVVILLISGCLCYSVNIDVSDAEYYLWSEGYNNINIHCKKGFDDEGSYRQYNMFILSYDAELGGKNVSGYLIDVFGVKNI